MNCEYNIIAYTNYHAAFLVRSCQTQVVLVSVDSANDVQFSTHNRRSMTFSGSSVLDAAEATESANCRVFHSGLLDRNIVSFHVTCPPSQWTEGLYNSIFCCVAVFLDRLVLRGILVNTIKKVTSSWAHIGDFL